MKNLTLKDLYNPNKIIGINVKGTYIECDHKTAFQEYKGSVELWQEVDNGILRLKRWLKKSIHSAQYSDKWSDECLYLEHPLRNYIEPTKK